MRQFNSLLAQQFFPITYVKLKAKLIYFQFYL